MQLALKLASLVTLAVMAIASPTSQSGDVGANIVSDAELDNWLRTTDADLTFVGGAKSPLAQRNTLITRMKSGAFPTDLGWDFSIDQTRYEEGCRPWQSKRKNRERDTRIGEEHEIECQQSNVPDAPVGTNAEFDNWLRTRDTNLTVGGDDKSLVDRNSQLATLVYRCSTTTCGGECTI
ncbi:hypothetical protein CCMSSC00406_0004886 [Pleurotus cornucopiae]|uniref:Uncharacterized protein n=1 Tax=Pleurotus cornucopiae TaxID=5321 RepID=A0ACB7J1N1_PLECO|nr:hypothetical protein CCMSSC00406_0004886 [Pleurotus cornucopiae]